METREILEKLQRGEMTVAEAEGHLRRQPFEEMGYAKLDMHRKVRSGFAEVIFCARKSDEHLLQIFRKLYETDGEVFGTRASQHQYELIREEFPQVEYDPLSHIIKIEKKEKERIGNVAVCTAGTADISVAEEAAQTAEYFGTNVHRIYDVGVSGIHRLLSRLDVIQEANCVVAVAGMEGALGTVVPPFPTWGHPMATPPEGSVHRGPPIPTLGTPHGCGSVGIWTPWSPHPHLGGT